VTAGTPPRKNLKKGCHVADPDLLSWQSRGSWSETLLAGRDTDAIAMSQYRAIVSAVASPVRSFPGSDCVLFFLSGTGHIEIGDRSFVVTAPCGAFVKPGETFRVIPADGAIELLATICPLSEEEAWPEEMSEHFDALFPQRVVAVNQQQREATGDRFFQRLVDERVGSTQITQFIGMIPRSRAPDHFHLYDELITVLSGEGLMWANEVSTPIRPGSMIQLPRKQTHCLECHTDDGMYLVGHFYPAGSPAVRY
jgi:mannose-6-phosphate isomerase-like protein (cupin superfamily)